MNQGNKFILLIKQNLGFLSGFFHLGSIQASNAIIQLLLFPLIIHVTGLEEFGIVILANTYGSLGAMFINYGTNQSGIKDVALFRNNPEKIAAVFYTAYYCRFFLFLLTLPVLFILYQFNFPHVRYFPFALTIVFAEVLNPFFFFAGIEKVSRYNLANLLSKSSSAFLIYLFVTRPELGIWVNFYLGITNIIAYLILTIYLIRKYKLTQYLVPRVYIVEFFRKNFFLVGNNLSSSLQQSFFVFALSFTGDKMMLGAYSFCDKIVWAFRMLIIAFTTAIFPRAVNLYKENIASWKQFRNRVNKLMAVFFSLVMAGILIFTPFIVGLFTKTHNELAIIYTRAICMVPLIASLNAMNVVDLLLKNKYHYIFIIAMVLLGISVIVSLIFIQFNNKAIFGYYQVIVEIFSLPLYLYFIRKSERQQDGA
nr:oligosaccharide flippase family protein [uncultured Sediminibacterium sp.]